MNNALNKHVGSIKKPNQDKICFHLERERKLQLMAKDNDYVSMYYLGEIYEERGDIENAINMYQKSVKGSSIAKRRLGELEYQYRFKYRHLF